MNGWPEPYGLLQTGPRDALWHATPFSPDAGGPMAGVKPRSVRHKISMIPNGAVALRSGLDLKRAQPETVTSCQRPPFRLRLLPWAWPGAVSAM
jgi:hypothetical protein